MKTPVPWQAWLLLAVLFAIGTVFRLAIFVENDFTSHDFGPALLGVAATGGLAGLTMRTNRAA